jgi:integral membrane sensor domain MASE1
LQQNVLGRAQKSPTLLLLRGISDCVMALNLRRTTAQLGLAGVYFATGKLGLSLAFLNESTSAVWPPTGIALASLLLWGRWLWPGVFVGAFLTNITTQGSLMTVLGIASGNTLEAVIGSLLAHGAPFRRRRQGF